jgi:hypothetical protein
VKKFFTVVGFVLIAGTSVFAQADFSFNAWGRGVFTPLSVTKDASTVSTATTTSKNAPRVGFTLKGISETKRIGFQADFQWAEWQNGAAELVGENAKVWVKPFDIVKLTVGKFNEDNFRGKVGTTEFNSWLVPTGGKDEDNIFSRFQAVLGGHIEVMPIKGMYIEAALGSSVNGLRANRNLFDYNVPQDALDVFKAIQVGAGYQIPDIGFVRAQFIGNNRAELRQNQNLIETSKRLMTGLTMNKDADVIEAAFQFTMIENLNVDLGAKIPLRYTTDTAFEVYPALRPTPPVLNQDHTEVIVQLPYSIALGAAYRIFDINLLGRVDFAFGGKTENEGVYTYDKGINLGAWLCANYYITPTFRVGVDFGVEMHGIDKKTDRNGETDLIGSDYSDVGIGPWVGLNVGDGEIKAGLMIMLPNSPRYVYDAGINSNPWSTAFSGDPIFTFPIVFTYTL